MLLCHLFSKCYQWQETLTLNCKKAFSKINRFRLYLPLRAASEPKTDKRVQSSYFVGKTMCSQYVRINLEHSVGHYVRITSHKNCQGHKTAHFTYFLFYRNCAMENVCLFGAVTQIVTGIPLGLKLIFCDKSQLSSLVFLVQLLTMVSSKPVQKRFLFVDDRLLVTPKFRSRFE